MKRLLTAAALPLLFGLPATTAHAGPWCAFYGPSTYNCGFHTYAQCLATISGVGGYCSPNHFEGYRGDRKPTGKRTRDNWW